jgi:hypothetical protein
MTATQILLVFSLPALFATMYLTFWLFNKRFMEHTWGAKRVSWYLGILVYWSVWCLAFPIALVGLPDVLNTFEIKPIDISSILILLVPIVITFLGRFILKFEKPMVAKDQIILMTTSLLMGVFEEVLWRGTFLSVFPSMLLFGFVWPTVWFAIWHLAPGSFSILDKWSLALGALVFGTCWGFVAIRTNTIFWTMLSHVLVGWVRVINIPSKLRAQTGQQ